MIRLDGGAGRPFTRHGMDTACGALDVPEAALWAVLRVETKGTGFLSDRRPRILFERHVFSRLTARRFDAAAPDVSSRAPGGYRGGMAEYARLARARALDDQAALKSASWGLPQLMGFNHARGGFPSVHEMVAHMMGGEDAHLFAMARFILADDAMHHALQRQRWDAFARAYNGADYRDNQYDTRLAAEYGKLKRALPDLTLRAAQLALLYLGYHPGPVDGLRGKQTEAAIRGWQYREGLPETGALDERTAASLQVAAFGPKSA